MGAALKLPVGIEDFREIRRAGFYYIDKTKLIEQLLDNWDLYGRKKSTDDESQRRSGAAAQILCRKEAEDRTDRGASVGGGSVLSESEI